VLFLNEAVYRPFPVLKPDWNAIKNPPENHIQITFLVQMESVNILTDPIFSDRCSAVQFIGPKRIASIPFTIQQLPPIDLGVISHNHYDHLDVGSVKQLIPKVKKWYVPLGLKTWMTDTGVKPEDVIEMDWWDSQNDGSGATVFCTPSQHFTGRLLVDRNKSLWASWAICGKKCRFFFAGDTGYRSVPRDATTQQQMNLPVCPAFKQIGNRLGPFDIAAIPIGAYDPRHLMSPVHLNPEDAVNVHIDIKSRQSVGMHWGTFELTNEPVWEPPEQLLVELKSKNLPIESFVTCKHGETRMFPILNDDKKEVVSQ